MSKLASQVSLTKSEIAFIDPGVSDLDTLLRHLRPEVDAIVLDRARSAPAQMAEVLRGRNSVAAVHVIAHGRPGELSFGSGAVSLDNLDAHDRGFAEIGRALDQDGALQLWSCNTGAGASGLAFVQRLADATGSAVAAASHTIGAAALGGRWQLDARSRAIDVAAPLSAEGTSAYPDLLGPTPTPGPGDIIVIHNGVATGVTYTSIDAAITAASAGDTIEVGAGNYSEHVVIDKAVTLDGANSGLAGTNNSRGAESVITGGVEITAAGATIDGFTVSGSYDSVTLNGTDLPNGMLIEAADATVENNVFTGDAQDSRPLSAEGSATNLTVTDNLVKNWNEGFYLVESSSGSVTDNTFVDDGNGVLTETTQVSISINTFTGSVGADVAPLPFTDATIGAFVFSNTYNGGPSRPITVYLNGPTGQTVTGSEVATTFHVEYHDGTATLQGNSGNDAISFSDNTAPVTINLMAGTASTASNALGGSDSVTFSGIENAIGGSGNDTFIAGTGNETFTGGGGVDTVEGFGAGYHLAIENSQWVVTNGTVTDTLSGIDKVDINNATYDLVDQFGATGGFQSVQAAIDAASSGDTILIAQGTYNENVDVTKSGLTIENVAGQQVTITGTGGYAGAISIASGVSNVTVKSSDGKPANFIVEGNATSQVAALYLVGNNADVKINGITTIAGGPDAGSNSVLTGGGLNNVLFENNVFGGNAAQLVYVNGTEDSLPQDGNVNFVGNTFSGAAPLLLGMDAPGEIINNTFSGTSQIAIGLGESGVNVSGNTFSPLTPSAAPIPTTAYFIGDGSYDPQTIENNNTFPQQDEIYIIQNGVRQDGVYSNIQQAINAAIPGDTVIVGNGTYTENVNLVNGVNVEGASQAGVIINGTITTPANFDNTTISNLTVNDYSSTAILLDMTQTQEVTSSGFSNVTFNLESASSAAVLIGNGQVAGSMALQGVGLTFLNVTMNSNDNNFANSTAFVYTLFHSVNGAQLLLNGVTLEGTASGTNSGLGAQWNMSPQGSQTAAVTIENSFTKGGGNFYVSGMTSATIRNNMFDGQGVALNGVTNGSVTGNTFENINRTYTANGTQNRGLVIENAFGATGDSNISVIGNTFQNITAADGAIAFQRFNENSANGPATIAQLNGINIQGNTFTNVTNAPIYLNPTFFGAGAVLPASISDSQLILGTAGNDSITAPATGNTDIFGGGGVDTVKDTGVTAADFSVVNGLWTITNGTNGPVDTLNNIDQVTDGSSNTFLLVGDGGYATIQDAIDAASNGDTILVAAGMYNESLNIDKGVTILGANAGVAGTGTRGAETIITGQSHINTTSQVIINGVEFLDNKALTLPLSSSDNFTALTIDENSTAGDIVEDSVFNRAPTGDPISSSTHFVGSSSQPEHLGIVVASVGVGAAVTIEDNLFTGNNPYTYAGDDWRSAVYSNGGPGATTIENNTFENVRSAVNADDFSSAVQITGNEFDHDGTGVSVGVGSDTADVTSITNNTFGVNVDTTFNFQNLTALVKFDAGATNNILSKAASATPNTYIYILGGSGIDNLTGTNGSDILIGGPATNTLTGGGGNDLLYGNATGVTTAEYTSTLTAGDITAAANADLAQLNNGLAGWQVAAGATEGTDLLNDVQVVQGASSGTTTGRFLLVGNGGFATSHAASDAASSGDTMLVQSGTDSSVQTIDTNNLTIDALSGSTSLNLLLGAGVTTITLADYSSGAGAHVSVTGNNLGDAITGNDGNDTLTGGTGNDTFNLGSGNNNVTGDGGLDTAHFASTLTAADFSFSSGEWVVGNGASTDDLSGISLVTDSAGHTFLLVGGGSQYSTISQATTSAQFAAGDIVVAPPPVVTATSPSVPATANESFSASSLFSASSSNGSAIVSYEIEDESVGPSQGFWTLNGLVEPNGHVFTVTAAQLSTLSFTAGSSASSNITDTLEVAAADAGGLGSFATFAVLATQHAPAEVAPTVTASNETVSPETSLAASNMFSGTAFGGSSIVSYEVEDTTSNSGSWIFNGVTEPANQIIDVLANQLSSLSFQTGFGSDTLMVRANDGTAWGNYATFTISPKANAAPPAGTSTVLDLEKTATGVYEYYDIGKSSILQAGPLDQISTTLSVVGIGGFDGSDTADLLTRNTSTGAFTLFDVSNNNVTGSASMGQVGLEWQVAGFGDFSGNSGETDMLMRDSNTGQFEIFDIRNNAITGAASMGQVGLEWQVAGFGDFSGNSGETDMLMRNTNTGAFEIYDISHNQIVGAAAMGQVGQEWQVLGFGDFSGNANETDMLMQNTNSGAFEVYDIRNNQIVSAGSMGQVGLQWTVAGFADFSGNANETDLLMRNSASGAFELYDISKNAITSASAIGSVGTEWQVTGVAADPPPSAAASTVLSGLTNDPASGASISQLTQAMASIAPPAGASTATLPLGQSPMPAADVLATTTQNNPPV